MKGQACYMKLTQFWGHLEVYDKVAKLNDLRIVKFTITKSTIASLAFFVMLKYISKPGTRNFMLGTTVCCSGTNCGPIAPNQHPCNNLSAIYERNHYK